MEHTQFNFEYCQPPPLQAVHSAGVVGEGGVREVVALCTR